MNVTQDPVTHRAAAAVRVSNTITKFGQDRRLISRKVTIAAITKAVTTKAVRVVAKDMAAANPTVDLVIRYCTEDDPTMSRDYAPTCQEARCSVSCF